MSKTSGKKSETVKHKIPESTRLNSKINSVNSKESNLNNNSKEIVASQTLLNLTINTSKAKEPDVSNNSKEIKANQTKNFIESTNTVNSFKLSVKSSSEKVSRKRKTIFNECLISKKQKKS